MIIILLLQCVNNLYYTKSVHAWTRVPLYLVYNIAAQQLYYIPGIATLIMSVAWWVGLSCVYINNTADFTCVEQIMFLVYSMLCSIIL